MTISGMNWSQVESHLKQDDRAVLPLGSTEQHGGLCLSVDSILSERVAARGGGAARHSGVPGRGLRTDALFPGLSRLGQPACQALMFRRQRHPRLPARPGFRRILIVNGHGGTSRPAPWPTNGWSTIPDRGEIPQLVGRARAWAKVQAIDPVASHASWMENFPWTRLPGVQQPTSRSRWSISSACGTWPPRRANSGDGNFGGYYERHDDEMLAMGHRGRGNARAARVLVMTRPHPGLGRRRHRRHGRRRLQRAGDARPSSSTPPPVMLWR